MVPFGTDQFVRLTGFQQIRHRRRVDSLTISPHPSARALRHDIEHLSPCTTKIVIRETTGRGIFAEMRPCAFSLPTQLHVPLRSIWPGRIVNTEYFGD